MEAFRGGDAPAASPLRKRATWPPSLGAMAAFRARCFCCWSCRARPGQLLPQSLSSLSDPWHAYGGSKSDSRHESEEGNGGMTRLISPELAVGQDGITGLLPAQRHVGTRLEKSESHPFLKPPPLCNRVGKSPSGDHRHPSPAPQIRTWAPLSKPFWPWQATPNNVSTSPLFPARMGGGGNVRWRAGQLLKHLCCRPRRGT